MLSFIYNPFSYEVLCHILSHFKETLWKLFGGSDLSVCISDVNSSNSEMMEETPAEQKYDNPGFDAGPEEIGMANLNQNGNTPASPVNGTGSGVNNGQPTAISMQKDTTTRIVNNTRSSEWNANNAVVIRNAMKTYRGAKTPVLNDFNMTVKEGTM